jgi:hypothetical protein
MKRISMRNTIGQTLDFELLASNVKKKKFVVYDTQAIEFFMTSQAD